MVRGQGLQALLEGRESVYICGGKQIAADESSLVLWIGSATIRLTQGSLGIGCSFLFTFFYVVARRFAVKTESVGIIILTFFSFHLVEGI